MMKLLFAVCLLALPHVTLSDEERPRLFHLTTEVNDAVWRAQARVTARRSMRSEVRLYGHTFVVERIMGGSGEEYVARSGERESMPHPYALAHLAAEMINDGELLPNAVAGGGTVRRPAMDGGSGGGEMPMVYTDWGAPPQAFLGGTTRTFIRHRREPGTDDWAPDAVGIALDATAVVGSVVTPFYSLPEMTNIDARHPSQDAPRTPFSGARAEYWPVGVSPKNHTSYEHLKFSFSFLPAAERGSDGLSPDTGCGGAEHSTVICSPWAKDQAKCVGPEPGSPLLPQGFELGRWDDSTPRNCAPQKGIQYFDMAAMEGAPNKIAMGYWDGKFSFIEGIVTPEWLRRGSPDCRTLRPPQTFGEPGWYPTRYCLKRDALSGLTVVSLSRFRQFD